MPFLTGYTLRKEITIDHTYVDSNLTDFPLLVKFTDDADIGANIDSNGYNIRFTSSDGETLLKYERQSFDNGGSTATGIFWVKVPTVSGASNTTIYIYYKSASPSDGADPTNVWDSNFDMVWINWTDPSGSAPQILDSTANDDDGTSSGSMDADDLVAGLNGNAIQFDDSGEVITGDTTYSTNQPDRTFEVFFKTPDNTNNHGLGGQYNTINKFGFWLQAASNGKIQFNRYSGGDHIAESSTSYSGDTWHHAAFTTTGLSDGRVFLNGVQEGTNTDIVGNQGSYAIRIGRDFSRNSVTINHVRQSHTVRSAAWLKFTSRNFLESDNEIAFGSEETDGGGAATRGMPFGNRSTAFNGGRTFQGILS